MKRFISIVLSVAMLLSIVPAMSLTAFAADVDASIFESGNGEAGDPYIIKTLSQLEDFRDSVYDGVTYKDKYVKLGADIDMSSKYNAQSNRSWKPIGMYYDWNKTNYPFSGTFDGDGHTINIYINAAEEYQALFGYCNSYATIKNLCMTGSVTVQRGETYSGYTAAIVGYAQTMELMSNCVNKATVTGTYGVGGLIGTVKESGKLMTNCRNEGTITATTTNGSSGGLVGNINVNFGTFTMEKSYNTGAIVGNGENGGLVGKIQQDYSNSVTIKNCYNTGSVTAPNATNVGGLVGSVEWLGQPTLTIMTCYNTGLVTARSNAAGLIGQLITKSGYATPTSLIWNCYWQSDKSVVAINSGSATNEWIYAKDADAFEKGEVAYLLNEGVTDGTQVWYQTLDTDKHPVFEGETVYRVLETCSENSVKGYSNTEVADPAHNFNADGICVLGDEKHYQPAVLNNGVYEISNVGQLVWMSHRLEKVWGGMNAKLMADITVDDTKVDFVPMGQSGKAYSGTFDGNGHTITLNLNGEENTALFAYAGGATIKELTVKGTINASGKFAASFIGTIQGGATIDHCFSEVVINSKVVGDGTHGGFVGVVSSGTLSMDNCAFTGKILGSNTTSCGGFIGWVTDGCRTTIKNSYQAGEIKPADSDAIARNNSGNVTISRCYYMNKVSSAPSNATYADEAAFKSGEVTYDLQGGSKSRVWGQMLRGANADALPTHATDSNEVCKLTFYSMNEEYAVRYANKGATAVLPSAPVVENQDFSGWKTDRYSTEAFTENTIIGGDMVLYATFDQLEQDGTENAPYLITSLEDLEKLAADVNGGTTYDGVYFKLVVDIDMTKKYTEESDTFTPIGYMNYISDQSPFCGHFDGDGHTIKLKINKNDTYQALFGCVSGGSIKNLNLTGSVEGEYGVASLVAEVFIVSDANVVIDNCSSTADVTHKKESGISGGLSAGLIGCVYDKNEGTGSLTVTNCYFGGTVTELSTNSGVYVSALIGNVIIDDPRTITVENCYSTATLAAGDGKRAFVMGYVYLDNSESTVNINNCYYLEGTADGSITKTSRVVGTINDNAKAMTKAQFTGGEVAWRLQNNNTKNVWGQTLTGENADDYPVWSNNANKVYGVKYMLDGKEYAMRCTNYGGTVEMIEPESVENYNVKYWVTDQDVNAIKFTEDMRIFEDLNVYAVYDEETVGTDETDTFYYAVGDNIEIDLNKYVKNASGNESDFTFGVDSSITLPQWLTLENGVLSGQAEEGGTYPFVFTVENNSVSLLSFDSETSKLYVTVNVRPYYGLGTADNPYLIPDLEKLEILRDMVNNEGESYEGVYFEVTADIDMSGTYNAQGSSWTPIGTSKKPFKGILDGKNHKISGMYINATENCQGLFGTIGGGEVKNLTVNGEIVLCAVTDAGEDGIQRVGGLAGWAYNNAKIENVNTYVTISDTGKIANRENRHIGGIVGYLGSNADADGIATTATVTKCEAHGDITLQKTQQTGGIIGIAYNACEISNNYNYANVTASNRDTHHVGGILGSAHEGPVVKYCMNMGDVTFAGADCVGGIVAYTSSKTTITSCANIGTIRCTVDGNAYAGGILGYLNNGNFGHVKNCYNYGQLLTKANCTAYAGAIMGWNKQNNAASRFVGNYYLNTSASSAYGTGGVAIGGVTACDEEMIASGELAYILQSANTDDVWGQKLTGTKDAYPVFATSDNKVHKVVFKVSGKEYATVYVNTDNTVTMPKEPTVDGGYAFNYWSTTESTDGEKFTSQTKVTGDVTLYAVKGEKTISTGENDRIVYKQGDSVSIDLSKYVKNATGNAGDYTFTLKSGSLPSGVSKDGSVISGTANSVGLFECVFTVTNNGEISLMSLDSSGTELTITIEVEKALVYTITTLEQLEQFRDDINNGVSSYEDYIVKLGNNIDMSEKYNENGESWEPIGNSSNPFKTDFDGCGYTISGLYINSTAYYQGLFGYAKKGSIKNLSVSGKITSTSPTVYYVGGILGEASVGSGQTLVLYNLYNYCDVSGYEYVGGILGRCVNYGNFYAEKLYNGGAIYAKGSSSWVGGIFGYILLKERNAGFKFSNAYNTGNVTGCDVGGIGGNFGNYKYATLDHLYNAGTLATTYRGSVGGIFGEVSARYYTDGHMYVNDVYYLEGTNCEGYVSYSSAYSRNGAAKSPEAFKTGEVAYLLRSDNPDSIWGQLLTGENADEYPVFTDGEDVYKVAFMLGGKEYKTVYMNEGNLTMPTVDESDEYIFLHWSTTESTDGEKAPESIHVDCDMTFYAVGMKKPTATGICKYRYDLDDDVYINVAKNIADYAGTTTFNLKAGQTLPEGMTYSENNKIISGFATKPGRYKLVFEAENDEISLLGLDSLKNEITIEIWVSGLTGDGTQESPYLIKNLETLEEMRDFINDDSSYASKYYKMTADVDMGEKYDTTENLWAPIGGGSNPFTGTFDGDGHTLTLKLAGDEYVALFPHVKGATVKNLVLDGDVKASGKFAASIIGENLADSWVYIENCVSGVKIESTVNGDGTHGGLMANVTGGGVVINNCGFIGSIEGSTTTNCGGLVGFSANAARTKISNSYVAAEFKLAKGSSDTFVRKNGNAVYKATYDNCYYAYKWENVNDATVQKDITAFATGEVTYLLNNGNTDGVWKQTLGENGDDYPNFNGGEVYKTAPCETYTNDSTALDKEHDYTDGCCTACGAVTAAETDENDVYKIENIGNLVWFAKFVNSDEANRSANAILLNDIDMSGYEGYEPIGRTTGLYYSSEGEDKGYMGTFDGNGKVIKNLSIKGSSTSELTYGVFGTLSGTVKNLGVENFTFTLGTKDCRAGGIVGQIITGGSVKDCYVANATITATQKVAGGIAGCNYSGTIENCYTYNVSIDATRKGGIVGDNRGDGGTSDRLGTIKNCYTDAQTIEDSQRSGNVENSTPGVSNEEFAKGDIARKLNGNSSEGAWGQGLGTDTTPVFASEENRVYKIVLDNNEMYSNKYIVLGTKNADDTYSLPENVLGYYIDDDFVDAGRYAIGEGDSITSVGFNVTILSGAQVRYGAGVNEEGKVNDGNGLRFIAQVDKSNFDGITYGMKIQAEESDNSTEVVADKWQDDDKTVFTVAITNLATSNYNRNYTATPFVKVRYDDGSEKTVYGTNTVTRSIYYVASGLLKNGVNEEDYTLTGNATLYNVLNAYVNMVGIRLNIENDGTMTPNTTDKGKYSGDAFFEVTCVKNENVYSVTIKPVSEEFENPVKIMGYWKEFIRINNNNSAVRNMITNEQIASDGTLTFDFTMEAKESNN